MNKTGKYIEVYKAKDGFRWRMKSRGDVINVSTTAFARRWNAHRSLKKVVKTTLPIIDIY